MIEFIITSFVIIATALFSYKSGKNKAENKNKEELLDAITNAREARDKLSDPDYVKWLRRQRSK